LLFQTLDDKKECIAVYSDGALLKELPDSLSKTWNYSSFLEDRDIEYASLYVGGKTLDEICPEDIQPQWRAINDKLKAFMRSFKLAKVSLNENCFFDLVPMRFLMEYCDLKNQITQNVFDTHEKPPNYEFLVDLNKVLTELKFRELKLNPSNVKNKLHKDSIRTTMKTIRKSNPYVDYDLFGTKTGRLTTKKNSFPALTLNKECRSVLEPNNDFFLELDYNAAEVRTVLALLGEEQPSVDVHETHREKVFNNLISREEAKVKTFEWLYNPLSNNSEFDKLYNRDKIVYEYWDGSKIINPFGREVQSDRFHALNLTMQSTFADLFLRQKIKVHKYLKSKGTDLALSIHDCLLLDMKREDKELIPEIIELFSSTELGNFKASVKIGKNFGEMKQCVI